MKCPFKIKVCSRCKRILIAYEGNFGIYKNNKDGLRNDCRECRRLESKKYYENNKEKILEKHKEYRENNKEYFKEYYENNKEELLEKHKEYYENNPHILFNARNRRRQKEENQGDGFSGEQWLEMMEFFDWRCAYSNEKLNKDNRSIDHIIALNNGGLNEIWNCVPMLRNLNSSKNTNDMLEWYMQQEFYSEERLNKIYEWIEYAKNKWQK